MATPFSWTIFYGDGNSYNSEQYGYLDVPQTNVQVIIGIDNEGQPYKLSGRDYYVYWQDEDGSGEWQGIPDVTSLVIQCMAHVQYFERMLTGLTIGNKAHQMIMKRADLLYQRWLAESRAANG